MECTLLACVLCQPVLASIDPPIPTFGRFLLEIFLISCFCSFLLRGAAHALAVSAHVHQQNGVQQLIHSAPTIEKRWSYVAVTLKQNAKAPPPKNSLATGDTFDSNTFLVTALGWLKKERKKMTNSDFWPFQVNRYCTLPLLL